MTRVLVIALLLLATAAGAGWFLFSAWLDDPLDVDSDTVFEIAPGTAFGRVSRNLASAGILDRPRLFTWYADFNGQAELSQAGEYVVRAGTTPRQLLDQFTSGNVRLHSFTIVEGWTRKELLAALARHPEVRHTLEGKGVDVVDERYAADGPSAEGQFLPETYRFPRGTLDVNVLDQAHEALRAALEAEWAGRDEGLPLDSPHEALTLASIIEKETALATERPRIAGVFVRRLNRGMRLQTDPTVIYGIGNAFDGNLTRTHLRTDTPYNTYTRAGLPPGPIALPGRAAIHAALHPADGNEIFFVATGLGDGSHKFTETREEHEAAVDEYLARQRAQRQGER